MSLVKVNTITETTVDAGVTVESVLLKDGNITVGAAGALVGDTVSERTAAAGVTIDGLLVKDGQVDPSASGVYVASATAYVGATAGAKLAAAIAALPSTGGTIDARGLVGAQTINDDIFASAGVKRPITLLFGPATYTVSVAQNVPSQCTLVLNGTTFRMADGDTQSYLFKTKSTNLTASVTVGSATITVSSATDVDVGDVIAVFGHQPTAGNDATTLNGGITSSDTTITVTSTTGFSSFGWLRIDSEIVSFTGKTATTFTGVTRARQGTSAAAHLTGAVIERIVYEPYYVTAVSGTTVTLDRVLASRGTTGTSMAITLGSTDIAFEGTGTLDGDKPTADVSANGIGIYALGARRLTTAPTIRFTGFDHAGVFTVQARDCTIDGQFDNIGWRSTTNVGASIWFFQATNYCVALGDHFDVNHAIFIDDRSGTHGDYDNASFANIAAPRRVDVTYQGILIDNGSYNAVRAPLITNWTDRAFVLNVNQWITNPIPTGNDIELGVVNPTGAAIQIATTAANGGNRVRCFTPGVSLSATPGAVGNHVLMTPTTPGVSADRGDANATLVHGTDAPVQRFATTLTANRTVTLSSTNVVPGAAFRIVRTGLGAFTLDVGGLKTIASATAAWVDVAHDGTAWRLTGYGTL